MSNFYLVSENQLVSGINSGDTQCAIEVAGTIYVYWRNSTVHGDFDYGSSIMVSTSDDNGETWTTPAVAYSVASNDVYPVAVVHNGSNFVMAVGSFTSAPVYTTRLLTSAAGLVFTQSNTYAWTGDNWAFPTDLYWDGTTYYMAGTAQSTVDGPLRTKVVTSTNLSSWTSLGYANQLTAADNVWASITVDADGVIHAVHREGDFWTRGPDDRILYTWYDSGGWDVIDILQDGTGRPRIVQLDEGFAIAYMDDSVQRKFPIWSWGYYEDGTFQRRGAVVQGYHPCADGDLLLTSAGFATTYAQHYTEESTVGALFFRAFLPAGEAEYPNVPRKRYVRSSPSDIKLENFEVAVSIGTYSLSLSDHIRYYVSPEDFGEKAQVLRRITAQSPFFDGTYLVHSTKENITEMITVYVLGNTANQVTENILLLEDAVSQASFTVSVTFGNHQEVWSCQAADYTISRGHLMMHNTRAMMKLSIPRLPDVSYGVV